MNNKKIVKIAMLFISALFIIIGNVFAGSGARNISSTSAQSYILGAARWAETDAGDTPLCNPAGAAFMEDGLYVHASAMVTNNRWAMKELSTGKEYVSEAFAAVPVFAQTYK